jgi:hypothetical protein
MKVRFSENGRSALAPQGRFLRLLSGVIVAAGWWGVGESAGEDEEGEHGSERDGCGADD